MIEKHLKDDPGTYSLPDDTVLVVSEYEEGDYCGGGYAIALNSTGQVKEYNCDHCSCYGPFDSGNECTAWDSYEEFESSCRAASPTALSGTFCEMARDYLAAQAKATT